MHPSYFTFTGPSTALRILFFSSFLKCQDDTFEPRENAYEKQNESIGGLTRLGKTVPSYRMALEDEIGRWQGFRNALASIEEREAFDEIMDMARGNGMASSNACNPIVFEPMAMSILLAQQKIIRELRRKLEKVNPDTF